MSELNIPYLPVIMIINNTDAACILPQFSIYTEIVMYKYFPLRTEESIIHWKRYKTQELCEVFEFKLKI